jgi:hypothetical protein
MTIERSDLSSKRSSSIRCVARGSERAGGLVEKQYLGLVGESASDAQTLLLSTRTVRAHSSGFDLSPRPTRRLAEATPRRFHPARVSAGCD